MTLQPTQDDSSPRYPTRKATLARIGGRWIRKVGAVAAASMVLWTAGCFTRLGGDVADPDYFYLCGDDWTIDQGEIAYPGTFAGCLAPSQPARGTLTIEEQVTLRLDFSDAGLAAPAAITADVLDPDDQVVATVFAGEPLEVTFAPGVWTIEVNSSYADEGNFNLTLEDVE